MESLEITSDPVLGAPLPTMNGGRSDITVTWKSDDTISEILRPLLFRMYVSCEILRLGTEARFAALVYLHRYCHAVHERTGIIDRPSPWVAASCLFLATKSEEQPRRLRDVINLAHILLAETSLQDGNESIICLEKEPPPLDESYWEAKKTLVETEQTVLRWLGFDLFVPRVHRTVSLLISHLSSSHQDKIFPEATRRLNDALFMGSALRNDTLPLAIAAIELAQQKAGEIDDRMNPDGWWRPYNVSDAKLRQAMNDLEMASNTLRRA